MIKENKINTYDRIIDASLVLFNTQGERYISTNHIAAYLQISPGNLYYHFRNKDEIILQLFKRYCSLLLQYLREVKRPQSTHEISDYMTGIYDVMWEYRFLFSDVNAPLARSAELLGEHNEFTRIKVGPTLLQLLKDLTDIGLIETDAISRDELALNLWLITKHWFSFDSAMHQHHLTEEAKFRGTYQSLSLLRPFICTEHKLSFDRVMIQLNKFNSIKNN